MFLKVDLINIFSTVYNKAQNYTEPKSQSFRTWAAWERDTEVQHYLQFLQVNEPSSVLISGMKESIYRF